MLGSPESHWFDLARRTTPQRRQCVTSRGSRCGRTLAYLTDRLGPPDGPEIRNWAWGRLHTLTFGHTGGRVSRRWPGISTAGHIRCGGDGTTVWATGSGITRRSSRAVVGPPFRFIADLGDLRNSLGLLAPGNSGRPDSPHYDDQIDGVVQGGVSPDAVRPRGCGAGRGETLAVAA